MGHEYCLDPVQVCVGLAQAGLRGSRVVCGEWRKHSAYFERTVTFPCAPDVAVFRGHIPSQTKFGVPLHELVMSNDRLEVPLGRVGDLPWGPVEVHHAPIWSRCPQRVPHHFDVSRTWLGSRVGACLPLELEAFASKADYCGCALWTRLLCEQWSQTEFYRHVVQFWSDPEYGDKGPFLSHAQVSLGYRLFVTGHRLGATNDIAA